MKDNYQIFGNSNSKHSCKCDSWKFSQILALARGSWLEIGHIFIRSTHAQLSSVWWWEWKDCHIITVSTKKVVKYTQCQSVLPNVMNVIIRICEPDPRRTDNSIPFLGERNTSPWSDFHPVNSTCAASYITHDILVLVILKWKKTAIPILRAEDVFHEWKSYGIDFEMPGFLLFSCVSSITAIMVSGVTSFSKHMKWDLKISLLISKLVEKAGFHLEFGKFVL